MSDGVGSPDDCNAAASESLAGAAGGLGVARDVTLHGAILGEFGHFLDAESVILDFGCGEGALVEAYRRAGLNAVGADVVLPRPGRWLLPVDPDNYRLPFSDGTFDVVLSNSVLEHVENLELALDEIRRVMKPGGASLHFFPPPAKAIEPHVFVPFGGLLRSRWWLNIWAAAGVRNSFQQHMNRHDAARSNDAYLRTKTFYRRSVPCVDYRSSFRRYPADREMIRHSYGLARHLAPFARLVARLYGALHQRCVFFETGGANRSGRHD